MSEPRLRTVNMGRNRANLSGSIGVRLINSGGSVTTARTNTGIFEVGSGIYGANLSFPENWNGIILWDDGKAPALYASDVYHSREYGSAPSYVGSVVWSKNPNNFITANTFGQRIDRMVQRIGGGPGGPLMTGALTPKEKEDLFKFLKAIFEGLKVIGKSVDSPVNLSEEQSKSINQISKNIQESKKQFADLLKGIAELDKNQTLNPKSLLLSLSEVSKTISGLKTNFSELRVSINDSIQNSVNNLNSKTQGLYSLQTSRTEGIIKEVQEIQKFIEEMKAELLRVIDLTDTGSQKERKLVEKLILRLTPSETLMELLEEEGYARS